MSYVGREPTISQLVSFYARPDGHKIILNTAIVFLKERISPLLDNPKVYVIGTILTIIS
jgi:hypothetical protein